MCCAGEPADAPHSRSLGPPQQQRLWRVAAITADGQAAAKASASSSCRGNGDARTRPRALSGQPVIRTRARRSLPSARSRRRTAASCGRARCRRGAAHARAPTHTCARKRSGGWGLSTRARRQREQANRLAGEKARESESRAARDHDGRTRKLGPRLPCACCVAAARARGTNDDRRSAAVRSCVARRCRAAGVRWGAAQTMHKGALPLSMRCSTRRKRCSPQRALGRRDTPKQLHSCDCALRVLQDSWRRQAASR